MSSALDKIKKYRNENNITTTSEYSNLTPLDKIEKYRSEHPYTEPEETTTSHDDLVDAISAGLSTTDSKPSIGGTIAGTGVQLGKGLVGWGEGVLDTMLTLGSSKWNPFMYLLYKGDINQGQATADELIKANATAEVLKELGYTDEIQAALDAKSLVKSDNLVGQLTETIGKQLPNLLIGASTTGVTGSVALTGEALKHAQEAASLTSMASSVFGTGVQEALNNGATRDQATAYGALDAAVEVGTELLFAGVGNVIGTGALDDVLIDKATSGIKNGAVKAIAKYGLGSIGEGIEELASDAVQPFIQKLTYAGDKELAELFADQDFAKDFFMGVLSSGVMGAINLPSDIKNGTRNIEIKNIESKTPQQIVNEVREQREQAKTETKPDKTSLPTKSEQVTKTVKPTVETETVNVDTTPVEETKIEKPTAKQELEQPSIETRTEKTAETKKSVTEQKMATMEGKKYTNKQGIEYTVPTNLYRGEGKQVFNSDSKGMNRFGDGVYYTPTQTRASNFGEVKTHTDLDIFKNPYIQGTEYNDTMKELLREYAQEHPSSEQGITLALKAGFPLTESVIPAKDITTLYTKAGYDSFIGGTSASPEYVSFTQPETKQTLNKEAKTKAVEKPKETPKVTPTELTESFSKIEESYKNANKYTGEIKSSLLKDLQKQYNEYRTKGGDKIISSLEEGYNTKQALEKVVLNKEVDDNKFTPAQANTAHMMMSSDNRIRQVERQIASKSAKSAKEAEVARILEEYDSKVARGMDTIEYYENLKKQYNVHQATKDVPTPKEKEIFTPTVNEAIQDIDEGTKALDNTSVSGNYILDEQLDLNEQYEFGDGVLVIESQDSRINDTYNEKLKMIKKQSKVDLPEYMESQQVKENYEKQKARESLNKTSKAMSLRQLFIDQYASLRKLDVQTKSYDVQNALLQSLTSGSLAATGINGDYIIDDQYHVTNIDSISKVFTPLIDMGTDSYRIAQQYMLLQMDYYNKVNDISYNTDTDDGYVNNIFPNKTTEDIQNDLADIKESNPDLVSFVESDIIPKVRKITRELNKMEIRAGVRNANTKVTVDFAKNEMGLDEAYINSNKTKNGYITVDTLDYWSAANPWYIPISRETGIAGTGTSMKSERNISKPKARKEGAEVYDIQPLADGFAEKYMSRINNIQQNKLRLAIANAMEKITGETSKPYTKKNGETGFITTTGDGQVQLRYLTNDNNGNLVNKVIAIDNYIADAYNGYQGLMQKLGIGNFTETMAGKGLQAISAARRAVLTKYNIPWQVKNVIVDFGDAIINNEFGIKGNALLIKNEMGAFLKDAKKNTSTYQEFMAFRGDYITKVQEKGYIQQDAKGLKGALNKVDNVLQTGELMTRYAVYKTARQVGYSIADAQRLSNSATTDFYKTGSALKALDTTGATIFLGTSMAGTNRFYDSMIAPTVNAATLVYKTAKEQGVKAALNKSTYDAYDQRTLNRFIGQTIKMSLIFGLGRTILKDLFKDKDKQEAIAGLSDSEIRDNICIPLGKDSILKIPKGRIWRSMDVIQDALTDSTIRDTDKMGVIDTFNYIIDNVGVNNLEDSLTMSSTIDIIKNRDYFGNEIYDANSKDKAKDIADYYAKQYGSWIYKAVKYANGGTDINPFISTFYTDTTTVSAYNNRFYNMKDAYENLAPKENGTFDDNDDMNNYFAWRVINYEKTNGELGKEIKILKSLKNNYTSSVDDIRKQEDKVKRLYNDIYNYIDSNTAYKYKNANGKYIVKYGTNYTYTLEKKDNGTYSYTKSRK